MTHKQNKYRKSTKKMLPLQSLHRTKKSLCYT